MCEMAGAPLVVARSDELLCTRGLLPLGEEDSVWLVSGVRPLLVVVWLCAKACELWLKTEEAVLVSELAEPSSGEFLFRFNAPEGLPPRRRVSTPPSTCDIVVAFPFTSVTCDSLLSRARDGRVERCACQKEVEKRQPRDVPED